MKPVCFLQTIEYSPQTWNRAKTPTAVANLDRVLTPQDRVKVQVYSFSTVNILQMKITSCGIKCDSLSFSSQIQSHVNPLCEVKAVQIVDIRGIPVVEVLVTEDFCTRVHGTHHSYPARRVILTRLASASLQIDGSRTLIASCETLLNLL